MNAAPVCLNTKCKFLSLQSSAHYPYAEYDFSGFTDWQNRRVQEKKILLVEVGGVYYIELVLDLHYVWESGGIENRNDCLQSCSYHSSYHNYPN